MNLYVVEAPVIDLNAYRVRRMFRGTNLVATLPRGREQTTCERSVATPPIRSVGAIPASTGQRGDLPDLIA